MYRSNNLKIFLHPIYRIVGLQLMVISIISIDGFVNKMSKKNQVSCGLLVKKL